MRINIQLLQLYKNLKSKIYYYNFKFYFKKHNLIKIFVL